MPLRSNSRPILRVSPIAALVGPDPTLTHRTPSLANSARDGLPGPASMFRGPGISLTRAAMTPRRCRRELGIDPGAVAEKSGRRRFAFACPDWTERLPHLGGALGAAVCEHFFEEGKVRRLEGTRAVALTGKGEQTLQEQLGLRISSVAGPDRPAGHTRQGEHS